VPNDTVQRYRPEKFDSITISLAADSEKINFKSHAQLPTQNM